MVDNTEKNNIESTSIGTKPDETTSAFQSEYMDLAMNAEPAEQTPMAAKGLSKADPCSPLHPPGRPEKIDPSIIKSNLAQIAGKIDGTQSEYVFTAHLLNGKAKDESVNYYTAGQDQSDHGPNLHFVDAKEEIGKNTRILSITPEPVSGGYKWAMESYPETNPTNAKEYLVRSANCELDENGAVVPSLGYAINHKQHESKYHPSVKYYAGLDVNPQPQKVGAGLKREAFYHGDSGKKLADISYLDKNDKPTTNGKPTSAVYYDYDTQQKTAEVEFDSRGIEAKRVEFKSGKPFRTLDYHDNRLVKRETQHDYLGGILITDFDRTGFAYKRQTQTATGVTELIEEESSSKNKEQVTLSFYDPTATNIKPYAVAECRHDDKTLTVLNMKLFDDQGMLRGSFDATKGKFSDKTGAEIKDDKLNEMLKTSRYQFFFEALLKQSK